ncbi:MAG: hypothetical protein ACI9T7_000260 [Oleiphilaceae bacterium]|jgi:hypothetical protein
MSANVDIQNSFVTIHQGKLFSKDLFYLLTDPASMPS